MTKLNQLIAIKKGVVADANTVVTGVYHTLQRTAGLSGVTKTYQPTNEDGETLPGEGVRVQVKVPQQLAAVERALTRLFDLTASLDTTNCKATAPVVVNGVTLTPALPVSTLLFLEKQLTDLATMARKLPLLDAEHNWVASEHEDDLWLTEPVVTVRTKKVPRNHVKAEATDRHPAQVEVFHEDTLVGRWTTVKSSGAVPHRYAADLLGRITVVQQAVKQAREAANMVEVTDVEVGRTILDYVFGR